MRDARDLVSYILGAVLVLSCWQIARIGLAALVGGRPS